MTALQAFLLGIIQGITEFLPISSSGHLVIVPYLLGWEISAENAFIFDTLVQVASLVAVFAFFWKDLSEIAIAMLQGIYQRKPFASPQAVLGWFLILATIPAGTIGLLFKDFFETTFSNPLYAAFALLGTSALLIVAEKVGNRSRDLKSMNWWEAVWIGFFQALAIFPGISRSGSTITGGMIRNFKRPASARFSFLMSIPIMLAAGFVATIDLTNSPDLIENLPAYFWGFLSSAVVGYLSIRWLLRYLVNHPLYIFSIYCSMLAMVTLLVYAFVN